MGRDQKFDIVMFSDVNMLPGLHVTLLTLLNNLLSWQAPATTIHLFLDGVCNQEKILLKETHAHTGSRSTLSLRDYKSTRPKGSNSLHGSETTYGRLDLDNLLPSTSNCIYLDCDLIVCRNILDLYSFFDSKNTLLVDGSGVRKDSIDQDLFTLAGLDLEGPCFNAGVMGIDLDLWRKNNYSQICRDVAWRYKGRIQGGDQTLLNVAIADSFKPVGDSFNKHLFPSGNALADLDKCVYHLVGSPKPWDFLGRFGSSHYRMWQSFYRDTAISHRRPSSYITPSRKFRTSKRLLKALFK